MSRVVLSEAVRHDRTEITAYTAERFGAHQARRLRHRFEAALNVLAKSPFLGRTSEILDPSGHRFRYFVLMKSFIIVYAPTDGGIRVVRFLHGARDLVAELDHEAGNDDNAEI